MLRHTHVFSARPDTMSVVWLVRFSSGWLLCLYSFAFIYFFFLLVLSLTHTNCVSLTVPWLLYSCFVHNFSYCGDFCCCCFFFVRVSVYIAIMRTFVFFFQFFFGKERIDLFVHLFSMRYVCVCVLVILRLQPVVV